LRLRLHNRTLPRPVPHWGEPGRSRAQEQPAPSGGAVQQPAHSQAPQWGHSPRQGLGGEWVGRGLNPAHPYHGEPGKQDSGLGACQICSLTVPYYLVFGIRILNVENPHAG